MHVQVTDELHHQSKPGCCEYTFSWSSAVIKQTFPFVSIFFPCEAPVTLDPNTGNSVLTISEHLTRSTPSDKSRPLPDNPERLGGTQVLGSEGFSSGKHSWDVEVGGHWAVGVTARTKNPIRKSTWGIYVYSRTDPLLELTPEDDMKIVSKDLFPRKVRVQLDYDQGILSFFDLDRKTLVHTIKHTFTETVFPYFRDNTKILPAELSVRIRPR